MNGHTEEELLRRIERLEKSATERNIKVWLSILRLSVLVAQHLGAPQEEINEEIMRINREMPEEPLAEAWIRQLLQGSR